MDLKTLTTPSLLWRRYQAAREAALLAEASNRSDAFFDDASAVVGGVHLRILRPDDLLVLDRLGNPFVTGGTLADITPAQVNQFLWCLALANVPGLLNGVRLRGFLHARRHADHARDLAEILDYIEAVFQDSPGPGRKVQRDTAGETATTRPLGAHFLASILVPLSVEVGPCDPLDGRPWQATPLPRIFQYLKVAAARQDSAYTDSSPSDDHLAAWLAEVNTARREGRLVGEGGIPGSPGLESINPADVAAAA